MDRISIKLLGRLKLHDAEGGPLDLPGVKVQALLAVLALSRDRTQSREFLAGLLWGDRFDDQARQSLRQALTKLRKGLGGDADPLVVEGDQLALNPEAVRVDAWRFEDLVDRGDAQSLAEACGLYEGELLDGLTLREEGFVAWIDGARRRFATQAQRALGHLAENRITQGQPAEAVAMARQLVGIDPLVESSHRLLMRAHAANGERAEALRQYKACAALLRAELGTAPDPETRDLHDRIRDGTETLPHPAPAGPEPRPKRKRPTLAVLPFSQLGATGDSHLADAMTEDITTALTRNRWLSVLAKGETSTFREPDLNALEAATELGADYVIQGSVRGAGRRIRVNVSLIDARSGDYAWAERYDRDVEDIFDIQDEITTTIAGTIEPELADLEGRKARHKPTGNMTAWDCYHLGLSTQYEFDPDSNRKAQDLFRRAIDLDPDFAQAHARLSYAMVISAVYFEADPTPALLDEALTLAKKAVALDKLDAMAHFAVGRAHLARREYDLSVAELKTAIQLNPCLAQAHCGLGDSLAYTGKLQQSVDCFDEAVRLSPHDPYRWAFRMYGAMAYLFMEEFEKAAEWALDAVRMPNAHYWAWAARVAALGYLADKKDETDAAIGELLRRKPGFTCAFARAHLFYLRRPEQIDIYLDGLARAGVPG